MKITIVNEGPWQKEIRKRVEQMSRAGAPHAKILREFTGSSERYWAAGELVALSKLHEGKVSSMRTPEELEDAWALTFKPRTKTITTVLIGIKRRIDQEYPKTRTFRFAYHRFNSCGESLHRSHFPSIRDAFASWGWEAKEYKDEDNRIEGLIVRAANPEKSSPETPQPVQTREPSPEVTLKWAKRLLSTVFGSYGLNADAVVSDIEEFESEAWPVLTKDVLIEVAAVLQRAVDKASDQ